MWHHDWAHPSIEYGFKQAKQSIREALQGAHGLPLCIGDGFIGTVPSAPNLRVRIDQPRAAAWSARRDWREKSFTHDGL
jgi:hypothetical protein